MAVLMHLQGDFFLVNLPIFAVAASTQFITPFTNVETHTVFLKAPNKRNETR
jgi:hypothetical protein